MEPNKIEVGERIKDIRFRLGMTQSEFGKESGLDTPDASRKVQVSYWENGRNKPSPATLKKISELSGVTVDEILFGDGVKPKEVGKRIRYIRKSLGLTMEVFGAKVLNAAQSLVTRWENGTSIPNNERLKVIAELGDISVDELLHGKVNNLSSFTTEELLDEIKRRLNS